MRILARQVRLETRLFLRRKDDLFWTLAFPLFFIVLFGLIYGDIVWDFFELRAIEYILPGIIVMALMTSGIMATTSGFAEERERGIYRRLSLTPLKRHTLLGGQLIQRYAVILVQTTLLLIVGSLAFSIQISGNLFWVWLVVTLGALCFLSIAFLLAGLIKSARAANGISMIVFFMLMFLGGVFFPNEMMPEFLRAFSNALPSTNLNDVLRAVMIMDRGIGEMWRELLFVGGWFVVSLLLAIRLFRWE
ncbi:MAG: ABC transporter permease [Dehalococcoidia bacterium]|nr:ABC transporter permease [Dehalococcoidia bacterium]